MSELRNGRIHADTLERKKSRHQRQIDLRPPRRNATFRDDVVEGQEEETKSERPDGHLVRQSLPHERVFRVRIDVLRMFGRETSEEATPKVAESPDFLGGCREAELVSEDVLREDVAVRLHVIFSGHLSR